MMKIKVILLISSFLVAIVVNGAVTYLKEFDFNEKDALAKWGKMILNGPVNYTLLKFGDNGYVQAQSEKTCSAIYYRMGFRLKDYPILTWKWKVLKFPDKAAAKTEKEKDDYAARIYIIFPFLNFSTSKFIEYIWDEDSPVGTVMISPEGDNIRLIVARSGRVGDGEWFSESRDVYADYIMAFGKQPALNVGAIAIMCDADSTKSEAQSLFDDIAIGTETGPTRRVER